MFLKENVIALLIITFLFSLVILYLLSYYKIADVLKVSVLAGTFGMAFAFAGNDLVNFIGVPLAGYESLQIFMTSNDIFMPVTALQTVIPTPSIYLMLAGMVMVLTLWLSSKPKQVIATTLKLSSKNQIIEQFSSNYIAREIVRNWLLMKKLLLFLLPNKIVLFISSRYSGSEIDNNHDENQCFDTVRAAVNMSVACILISLGTNLNLPLSTTYVVFMVTMGSSIGDGAWNSQNAVYRLSGVITVVSTWFYTAFIAFFLTAFVTFFIYWGGVTAILILILIIAFFYFKSNIISKKKTQENVLKEALIFENVEKAQISSTIKNNLFFIFSVYKVVVESIISNERKELKESLKNAEQIYSFANIQKENIEKVISKFDDELEKNYNYLIMIEKLQNASKALWILTDSVFKYLDNNHKSLSFQQKEEFSQLSSIVTEFTENIFSLFENYSETKIDEMYEIHSKLNLLLERSRKRQILRIKNHELSITSRSVYFELIHQTEIILNNSISVLNIYNMFEDKVSY
ncbi:MAG: hypothetical protein IPO21_01085 [Bacteroidales bacterium]|nr:hypothetical protein [Bacteroidales bacterium]